LIIEQTFFCALPPVMRQNISWKMHELLAQDGMLAGLFLIEHLRSPFGSQQEYELLLKCI
jgi:hypothetical protein